MKRDSHLNSNSELKKNKNLGSIILKTDKIGIISHNNIYIKNEISGS
jgi:hypothetical protein